MKKRVRREFTKATRALSLISITGVFIIVAVIVFGIFKIVPLNAVVIDLLGVLGISCIACMLAVPWVERLQKKEFNKVVCIVFISIVSACMMLWLICWILTMNVIISKSSYSAGLYNLVRISLILTIQFLVASTIAYIMLKYKKTMIVFQVITYLSNLYIDFYATYLILCLNIVDGDIKFPGGEVIFSKFMIAILVIAILYVAISNGVVKSSERKRNEKLADDFYTSSNETKKPEELSVEERMHRLKSMKDDGLISDEEFEKKKSEIMKEL